MTFNEINCGKGAVSGYVFPPKAHPPIESSGPYGSVGAYEVLYMNQ